MLHTFNARELINLQSETNFAFHSCITASDFPQVHDFFELSLVTAGKMLLGINDDVYEVEAGCLMLIPPGYVHTKQDLGGCRFMNIAFPVRTMEDPQLSWPARGQHRANLLRALSALGSDQPAGVLRSAKAASSPLGASGGSAPSRAGRRALYGA